MNPYVERICLALVDPDLAASPSFFVPRSNVGRMPHGRQFRLRYRDKCEWCLTPIAAGDLGQVWQWRIVHPDCFPKAEQALQDFRSRREAT